MIFACALQVRTPPLGYDVYMKTYLGLGSGGVAVICAKEGKLFSGLGVEIERVSCHTRP